MELLIKIPQEFEQHFKQDAFEDSLHRLSADAHLMAGIYEQETAKMLRDSFKNAVPIPPHGRLIDENMLLCFLGENIIYDSYGRTIAKVPTVIPAEEGE